MVEAAHSKNGANTVSQTYWSVSPIPENTASMPSNSDCPSPAIQSENVCHISPQQPVMAVTAGLTASVQILSNSPLTLSKINPEVFTSRVPMLVMDGSIAVVSALRNVGNTLSAISPNTRFALSQMPLNIFPPTSADVLSRSVKPPLNQSAKFGTFFFTVSHIRENIPAVLPEFFFASATKLSNTPPKLRVK